MGADDDAAEEEAKGLGTALALADLLEGLCFGAMSMPMSTGSTQELAYVESLSDFT